MGNNNLIVPKLGLFQKARKAFFIRRMSYKKSLKYSSLPEYLKNDDEVIARVIEANSDQINYVPFGKLESIVKRNARTYN